MKYQGVIETTGSVDAITFACDGAQFVNASGMTVNLYDAVTCQKIRDFDVKQSWFALDFSPDDSRVVGGSRGLCLGSLALRAHAVEQDHEFVTAIAADGVAFAHAFG